MEGVDLQANHPKHEQCEPNRLIELSVGGVADGAPADASGGVYHVMHAKQHDRTMIEQ